MFDLIRSVAAGFGGKLKHHPEARKLVWPLLVTLFFSAFCVAFIAFVSYSRYRDLAGFLPYASTVALCFTVGIALFMYYVSGHVSTFAVESWVYGQSRLTWQGVVIFAACGVLVGIIDYRMNIDGAADVATNAAGTVSGPDVESIRDRYAPEIGQYQQQLDQLLTGQLGGYGWQDQKGTYHLNSSGKKFQRSISANLDRLQQQRDEELNRAFAEYETAESKRQDRQRVTHDRLRTAVKGVYFLQFLLTLVIAFILVKMDEALQGMQAAPAPGSIPASTAPPISRTSAAPIGYRQHQDQHRPRNYSQQHLHRPPDASGRWPAPEGINRGINTGMTDRKALEDAIFADGPEEFTTGINTATQQGVNPDDIAFLRKYRHVVRALLDGQSYGQITTSHQVSKSTAQNVKRTMKAVNLI